MNRIIYLTGFMGSGKSTIGPILANTLGWDFFDLDKVIEKKAGMKIPEIFEKEGEQFFRELEIETLSALTKHNNAIIALGGGTVTNNNNINLIKETGKLIYLKATPESVYLRLRYKRDRPLLTLNGTVNLEKNEFIKKISRMLDSRKSYYEKADIIIDTDIESIGKIVDRIAKIIRRKI